MSPPSSCIITGVFPLSEGYRNTDPSYFATYLSALEFSNVEKFINISIRKFTASAESLFEDSTFVFMVAKGVLPAGEDGMLDSIYCTPFISPPEGFKQYYPLQPTHTVFVTGTVTKAETIGPVRSFTLGVSEYVRDERRTFTISFEYDSTTNRWKNVRLPNTGSTVTAAGTFLDIAEDGHGEAILNLLDISYGTPETVTTSPTRMIGHRKVARSSAESETDMSSPTRTIGYRKAQRSLDEPQAPASSQQSPIATGSNSKGTKSTGKTSKKRTHDEVEGTEEIVLKGPRTRNGRGGKASN